jgi:hypothetical protein
MVKTIHKAAGAEGAIRLAAIWSLLVAGLTGPLQAGTIRHDRSDANYTWLAADPNYAAVGCFPSSGGGVYGSGALIANNYVLTAAHVTSLAGPTWDFKLNGTTYHGAWTQDPNWTTGDFDHDIAVVRLNELVLNVTPASPYTGIAELTRTATIVGYGLTGTGLTGYVAGTAGTKRAGNNTIDSVSAYTMAADFDSPTDANVNAMGSSTPLNLEYMAAPGDSGGPVFINLGGIWIAGITTGLSGTAKYGDTMTMTRVSAFKTWITDATSTSYTVRWVADSNAFNSSGNWQATRNGGTVNFVPGPADVAVFDSNGARTVTWPAGNVTNDQLNVRRGDVTFDLSGRTYALKNISTSTPSVVVGGSGPASLTITHGTLSSSYGFIGPFGLDNAQVTVSGSGAAWSSSASVYVGGSSSAAGGTGLLAVGSGATMSVSGTVKVWPGGTVRLDGGSLSAGQLVLAGGRLEGAGAISSSIVANTDTIDVSSGSMTLSGQLSISSGATLTKTGAGTLIVNSWQSHGTGSKLAAGGGVVDMGSDAGSDANRLYNLTVNVGGSGRVNFGAGQHLSALNVNQGIASVSAGGNKVVLTKSVSVDTNSSVFDITDNYLVVKHDGNSPLNQVTSLIKAGRGSGTWTGNGITSSTIDPALQAIGVVDNRLTHYPTFGGASVDGNSILVRATYGGDADLNGTVDFLDYGAIDYAYAYNHPDQGPPPATPMTGWQNGDFDYDGEITFLDYGFIDFVYATLNPEGGGVSGAAGAVPEPAAVVLLGLGLGALVSRRRPPATFMR